MAETPTDTPTPEATAPEATAPEAIPAADAPTTEAVEELGGPKGPEPTRFGDWERGGRCSDF